MAYRHRGRSYDVRSRDYRSEREPRWWSGGGSQWLRIGKDIQLERFQGPHWERDKQFLDVFWNAADNRTIQLALALETNETTGSRTRHVCVHYRDPFCDRLYRAGCSIRRGSDWTTAVVSPINLDRSTLDKLRKRNKHRISPLEIQGDDYEDVFEGLRLLASLYDPFSYIFKLIPRASLPPPIRVVCAKRILWATDSSVVLGLDVTVGFLGRSSSLQRIFFSKSEASALQNPHDDRNVERRDLDNAGHFLMGPEQVILVTMKSEYQEISGYFGVKDLSPTSMNDLAAEVDFSLSKALATSTGPSPAPRGGRDRSASPSRATGSSRRASPPGEERKDTKQTFEDWTSMARLGPVVLVPVDGLYRIKHNIVESTSQLIHYAYVTGVQDDEAGRSLALYTAFFNMINGQSFVELRAKLPAVHIPRPAPSRSPTPPRIRPAQVSESKSSSGPVRLDADADADARTAGSRPVKLEPSVESRDRPTPVKREPDADSSDDEPVRLNAPTGGDESDDEPWRPPPGQQEEPMTTECTSTMPAAQTSAAPKTSGWYDEESDDDEYSVPQQQTISTNKLQNQARQRANAPPPSGYW